MTYVKGSYEVHAENPETAEAIFNALDMMATHKSVQEKLVDLKHGHVFGFTRQCKCGAHQINYHLSLSQDNPVPICRKYLENVRPGQAVGCGAQTTAWAPDKILGLDIPDGWTLVHMKNAENNTDISCSVLLRNREGSKEPLYAVGEAANMRQALQNAIDYANRQAERAALSKSIDTRKVRDTMLVNLACLLPYGSKLTVESPENFPSVLRVALSLKGCAESVDLSVAHIGDAPDQKSCLLKEVAYLLESAYRQANKQPPVT